MKWSVLFLFFLTACSLEDPYNYSSIAHSITNKTILELEKDKKLMAVGTGGGMMGDIYNMSITFNYYNPMNLQESRKLIVHIIQTYLKNINTNKEIRPYLHNYPSTIKDIEITVFVYNKNNKDLLPGEIEVIESLKNKLIYKLAGEGQFEPWPILKEETYEEALSILAGNQ